MIRLLTGRARIGLVVAAMAVAVAMVAFAQTTEPAIESVSASDQPAAPNSSPTGDENSTDKDTSVLQSDPPVGPPPAAAAEDEIQRETRNQFAEYITWWAQTVTWWLEATAIFLTLFAVAVAIAGFLSFKRFREIETDAKNSVKKAAEHAEAAARHVKEIEKNLARSDEIVRGMTAKTVDDNTEEEKRAVKDVLRSPKASLIDKAIAQAVSLQQQGGRNEAVKKWRAIAHIAESIDNDLAGRAWFSIAYLLQDKDPEGGVSAYDQVLRLTPDSAEAYTNRGIARAALERYDDAIADHNEAIRLKPDYAKAYTNRGSAKAALERYDDAIADFNEALRLKPDFAAAYYNRGLSEAALGLESEAKKDFETALKLARNANDADLLGHMERVLRNHAAESS